MRELSDIVRFLGARADRRRLLAVVADLGLPDGWIGAGFVRNAVWDALHGREGNLSLNDIDVVYCDPRDVSEARDRALEARLRECCSGLSWEVRNQARMHIRNGDAPYRDTRDAVARWPETATAIAARLVAGRVVMIAPHGVADLLGLTVRPTPAFRDKMDIFRQRIAQKDWLARWPRLRVVEA